MKSPRGGGVAARRTGVEEPSDASEKPDSNGFRTINHRGDEHPFRRQILVRQSVEFPFELIDAVLLFLHVSLQRGSGKSCGCAMDGGAPHRLGREPERPATDEGRQSHGRGKSAENPVLWVGRAARKYDGDGRHGDARARY